MNINTVIFDIGNVLVDFCWEKYFKSFGYSEEVYDKLVAATVKHPMWNEFDRGNLTEEQLLEAFIKNDPSIEKEIRQVYENLEGIIEKRDYAIPWVLGLKEKGYQVLVLSNYSQKSYRECANSMRFLDHVDGGVMSFQEHMVKPEPRIYQLIIDRYGLEPEKCVFIDDTQINLDAAEKFGIHTICFHTREQVLADLNKLGVN